MPKSGVAAVAPLHSEQSRAACLECRLNKIRCRPSSAAAAAATGLCQRCEQFGFDCRYAQQHKRGRKPRSKLQNTGVATTSIASVQTYHDSRLSLSARSFSAAGGARRRSFSAAVRQRAWQTLTRSASMRGSTYTFVAAGNTGVEQSADGGQASSSVDAVPSSSCSTGCERRTLRNLLRRVDQRSGGGAHVSRAAPLPRLVDLCAPSDPRHAGLLSEAECSALVQYFDQHMLSWTAVLASAASLTSLPAPTWSDGFLLSVVVYVAAHFSQSPQREALGAHARSLAVQAFANVQQTSNVVLALDLLAVWKAADDDYSDAYAGYADHVASMLASTSDSQRSRQSLRVRLFHYVQRSVYQLHFVATLPTAAMEHTLPPLELPGDWFLFSDAESTAIQCKFKALFLRQARWGHTASSCLALLDAFCADMEAWEKQWSQRGTVQGGMKRVHRCGFEMLGKSVCMHITSIAFRRGLDAWRDAAADKVTAAAAAELVQRSYRLCIDSCVALLFVVPRLEPTELLHMPDSIVILINHAALMSVYLLLAPAAVAERGYPANIFNIHDDDDDGALMATECIDAIKAARNALLVAARTLPTTAESTCALSAEHLDSLAAMLCDDEEGVAPLTWSDGALQTDNHAPVQQGEGDASAGWDWLQAFLDDATALPLFLNQQQ